MCKAKSRRSSKVKQGKDQARNRYRNENRSVKNKKIRQERHQKRLAKIAGKV
jgi:hypothetical protein